MTAAEVIQTLSALVRARYSLIHVTSVEEARVEEGLTAVASDRKLPLWTWSYSDGLKRADGDGEAGPSDPIEALRTILGHPDGGLYLMRDLDPFFNDPLVRRLVRDAAVRFRTAATDKGEPVYKALILLSPGGALPPDLRDEAESVDWPLPSRDEVGQAVTLFAEQLGPRRATEMLTNREGVVEACLGLTQVAVSNVLARSLVVRKRFDLDVLLAEKEQAAKRSGVIEFVRSAEGLDAVGGLDILKGWLGRRRKAFSAEARAFGVPAPRGMLLLGIPGTGKSLCARAVAAAWGLPLLRLDVARLMGSLVGESERKMGDAIRTAAALAPCVLWADEIEKALAGHGTDTSGVTTRLVGQLLSWMADRDSSAPVFVVATANDVSALPPELLRKGRFDEVFFVDLPTRAEREAILRVHLAKRNRDPDRFESLGHVAGRTEGFSGAEMEQIVIEALTEAFGAGREVSSDDLIVASDEIVPLSKTMGERVQALRKWSRGRARLASTPEAKAATGARVVDVEDEVRS